MKRCWLVCLVITGMVSDHVYAPEEAEVIHEEHTEETRKQDELRHEKEQQRRVQEERLQQEELARRSETGLPKEREKSSDVQSSELVERFEQDDQSVAQDFVDLSQDLDVAQSEELQKEELQKKTEQNSFAEKLQSKLITVTLPEEVMTKFIERSKKSLDRVTNYKEALKTEDMLSSLKDAVAVEKDLEATLKSSRLDATQYGELNRQLEQVRATQEFWSGRFIKRFQEDFVQKHFDAINTILNPEVNATGLSVDKNWFTKMKDAVLQKAVRFKDFITGSAKTFKNTQIKEVYKSLEQDIRNLSNQLSSQELEFSGPQKRIKDLLEAVRVKVSLGGQEGDLLAVNQSDEFLDDGSDTQSISSSENVLSSEEVLNLKAEQKTLKKIASGNLIEEIQSVMLEAMQESTSGLDDVLSRFEKEGGQKDTLFKNKLELTKQLVNIERVKQVSTLIKSAKSVRVKAGKTVLAADKNFADITRSLRKKSTDEAGVKKALQESKQLINNELQRLNQTLRSLEESLQTLALKKTEMMTDKEVAESETLTQQIQKVHKKLQNRKLTFEVKKQALGVTEDALLVSLESVGRFQGLKGIWNRVAAHAEELMAKMGIKSPTVIFEQQLKGLGDLFTAIIGKKMEGVVKLHDGIQSSSLQSSYEHIKESGEADNKLSQSELAQLEPEMARLKQQLIEYDKDPSQLKDISLALSTLKEGQVDGTLIKSVDELLTIIVGKELEPGKYFEVDRATQWESKMSVFKSTYDRIAQAGQEGIVLEPSEIAQLEGEMERAQQQLIDYDLEYSQLKDMAFALGAFKDGQAVDEALIENTPSLKADDGSLDIQKLKNILKIDGTGKVPDAVNFDPIDLGFSSFVRDKEYTLLVGKQKAEIEDVQSFKTDSQLQTSGEMYLQQLNSRLAEGTQRLSDFDLNLLNDVVERGVSIKETMVTKSIDQWSTQELLVLSRVREQEYASEQVTLDVNDKNLDEVKQKRKASRNMTVSAEVGPLLLRKLSGQKDELFSIKSEQRDTVIKLTESATLIQETLNAYLQGMVSEFNTSLSTLQWLKGTSKTVSK